MLSVCVCWGRLAVDVVAAGASVSWHYRCYARVLKSSAVLPFSRSPTPPFLHHPSSRPHAQAVLQMAADMVMDAANDAGGAVQGLEMAANMARQALGDTAALRNASTPHGVPPQRVEHALASVAQAVAAVEAAAEAASRNVTRVSVCGVLPVCVCV